jgi:hypothetical protein
MILGSQRWRRAKYVLGGCVTALNIMRAVQLYMFHSRQCVVLRPVQWFGPVTGDAPVDDDGCQNRMHGQHAAIDNEVGKISSAVRASRTNHKSGIQPNPNAWRGTKTPELGVSNDGCNRPVMKRAM